MNIYDISKYILIICLNTIYIYILCISMNLYIYIYIYRIYK